MRTFRYKPLFEVETFDMTPIIDVVFLLIIFFMLVAQFIVAEQYKVSVPGEIKTAQAKDAEQKHPLTITVMPDDGQGVVCANCLAVNGHYKIRINFHVCLSYTVY